MIAFFRIALLFKELRIVYDRSAGVLAGWLGGVPPPRVTS